ncbi:MAG: hypothetical protein WB780_15310 [Candidatus Acidiferrales bacterium]
MNGYGVSHRKKYSLGTGADRLWRGVRYNGYPPEFQVLCCNCYHSMFNGPTCTQAGQPHCLHFRGTTEKHKNRIRGQLKKANSPNRNGKQGGALRQKVRRIGIRKLIAVFAIAFALMFAPVTFVSLNRCPLHAASTCYFTTRENIEAPHRRAGNSITVAAETNGGSKTDGETYEHETESGVI